MFIDGVDVREIPLATPARRDRLRAAGAVPVLRHDWRERRVWRAEADTAADGGRSAAQRLPAHAAAVAPADKDVATFRSGYDTMVGERGHHAVGRTEAAHRASPAPVLDPRILILDDALSAVDTYTEEEILARLRA